MTQLSYLPADHPIHRVSPDLLTRIKSAQDQAFPTGFGNAFDFHSLLLSQHKLALGVPQKLRDVCATEFTDQSFGEFRSYIVSLLESEKYPAQAIPRTAENVATRAMLLRAYAEPDAAVAYVKAKVLEVAASFPRTAKQIEVGKNPGDVLDPFILAATQYLLQGGEFEPAISATVSHKAIMMIEGLMGHLHEDTLGMMRGNVRIPEPRGEEQEQHNYLTNPFPGADLLQPPLSEGEPLRFHQIKSKTGSAKGGDGKRLGIQLEFLKDHYQGEIYYDALIGNTLVGHRSKAGVEKAAPSVRVLVGQAAFKELTRSNHGASLLLRIYHEAFIATATETGYTILEVTEAIVAEFRQRAEAAGETYLETILDTSISGPAANQDSAIFNAARTARRGGKAKAATGLGTLFEEE